MSTTSNLVVEEIIWNDQIGAEYERMWCSKINNLEVRGAEIGTIVPVTDEGHKYLGAARDLYHVDPEEGEATVMTLKVYLRNQIPPRFGAKRGIT